MRCGKKKVWLDPNEINEIANTNSSKFKIVNTRKLVWFWYRESALIEFATHHVYSEEISRVLWAIHLAGAISQLVLQHREIPVLQTRPGV